MFNIEIHNIINQVVQIFYRFGVWRNEDGLSVHRKIGFKLFYLIVNVCLVASLITSGLLSTDKNESVFLVVGGLANVVVTVKLIYILWKKEKILAFLLEIGTHSVANEEEFIEVNDKLQKLLKFSFVFIFLIFVSWGGSVILYLPIFTSERMLPYNVWFPEDWRNNQFVYWIAYAFLSTGMFSAVTGILLNVIIWYLMQNSAIKYQILGNQFRNIGTIETLPTKPKAKKRKISDEEKQKIFHEKLIELIKTHQNIKDMINRFRDFFANLFFAQIITSGICICGSVYVLAFSDLHENVFQSALYVVILVYNLFDIFMVMYFGNEIMLSSDRLSYCLFESNWIEQSKSCKKCIIILTEVLKQPHVLVIGLLYPLTLETFISILNGAYSMFNILKNLR